MPFFFFFSLYNMYVYLAGFIWLKCKEGIEDCGSYLLEKLKIRARGGERFGVSPKYARISMIGTDDEFNEFLKRVSNAKKECD